MFQDILIVFDGLTVSPETLSYARELALRMDARVTLLMLAQMSFVGRTVLDSKRSALSQMEDRAAQLLTQSAEPFIQQGREVRSAFRVGDPAQEMLKFLADRPPFQAIVWGSTLDLPPKGHWIGRVSSHMECPLITVSKKEKS